MHTTKSSGFTSILTNVIYFGLVVAFTGYLYSNSSSNNSSFTCDVLPDKESGTIPEIVKIKSLTKKREVPRVVSKKLVVITGVTEGLGRAMLDRFVEHGWFIAGCGLTDKRVNELTELYGPQHSFKTVDITNVKAVTKWAKGIIKRFGAPDLLINNASLINTSGSFWTISEEEFSKIINVNVNGTSNVIRAFVPAMIKQKHGVIVTISSSWGKTASRDFAPYCASKFAIEGLSQALAQELPAGLCVVTLDPGPIDALLRSDAKEASYSPSIELWSHNAVPFILNIGPDDNGKSLTCPEVFE